MANVSRALFLLAAGAIAGLAAWDVQKPASGDRDDAADSAPSEVEEVAARHPGGSAPPSAPEVRGGEFGFAAYSYPGPWVPDCAFAAGPSHLVVPVNRFTRFFTKDGTMTYDAPLYGTGGFFSIAADTTIVFDPVALFDPHSQRFFVAAASRNPERLYLAVSDDSDPNGNWYQYDFDTSVIGLQTDFPCIGVDATTVYVSVKMEDSNPANRWKGVVMWEKASILNGGTAVVTRRRFSIVFPSICFAGVTTYDAAAPAQYFASQPNGPFVGANQIRLTALRDPQGARIFDTFDLTIPQWWYVPVVAELGSAAGISNEPAHFYKHGIYRNGKLWIANSCGPTSAADRAVVHWYEIDINGWPVSGSNPSLAQWGKLDLGLTPQGNPISTIYPDIAVDAAGEVGVACNRTSADEIMSVIRAFRLPTDAPGALPNVATWKLGTAPHDGSVGGAWGDYSSLDEDPAQPGTFWGHVEFREPGAWRTWVGRFDSPLTATLEPVAAAGVSFAIAGPNPFASQTSFAGTLDRAAAASLDIVDVSGRVMRTLFDGRREAGTWNATWDGRDHDGRRVANGVYLVRLQVDGRASTKKVTLLR